MRKQSIFALRRSLSARAFNIESRQRFANEETVRAAREPEQRVVIRYYQPFFPSARRRRRSFDNAPHYVEDCFARALPLIFDIDAALRATLRRCCWRRLFRIAFSICCPRRAPACFHRSTAFHYFRLRVHCPPTLVGFRSPRRHISPPDSRQRHITLSFH